MRESPTRLRLLLQRLLLLSWLLLHQVQVRHLQCERLWINVSPVGEDDDGQLIIRETLNRGEEPDRVAIVRHARVALVGIEKPAETIAHDCALERCRRSICGLHWS